MNNPFQSKNPYCSGTTYLLKYGEDNLTMYHSLKRNSMKSMSRGDLLAQTTILKRVKKEAFESQRENERQDDYEEIETDKMKNMKECDSFWKNISRLKSMKTFRNPYTQTYSSAPFGSPQQKTNTGKSPSLISPDLQKKKEMIRQEVGIWKCELAKQKSVEKDSFSVYNLYKEKKNYAYPSSQPDQKSTSTRATKQKAISTKLNKAPIYPPPRPNK